MPVFDPLKYAYSSRRTVTYAPRAMACTSVPLGAQIGLDIMKRGGSAADAAVAMAAAMPILEPTGNGMGGDCFALIWSEKEKKLYGLNASGVSPKALSPETVRRLGFNEMPREGWIPVMVPGAPAGWTEINRRFGSMPLSELFAPAADYARHGAPVTTNVSLQWSRDGARILRAAAKDAAPHAYWVERFMKADGSPYRAGELFRWPEYADTLEELAADGCESFYRGKLMKKTVFFSRSTGGFFQEEDFEGYHPEWVEPITADYRGYTVCEIPPNGHGISVLMALNILKGMEMPAEKEDPETWHRIIESVKLAFSDAKKYVADPRYMRTKVSDMLDERYAAARRGLIGGMALEPAAGIPGGSDTIYLCTADRYGNMVSFIQSNYTIFGAGVAVPGTGISFQNRGANFSLDPRSDNCLAGGKKSYHTIIPGFLTKDGEAVGPFGVMGGFMQPQGHVQLLVNTIDYHMNPQECLDAPRFQWTGGKHILLERETAPWIGEELSRRGHEVEVLNSRISMGRGQIIWRTEGGLLAGGTEPRCDGTAAAW